MADISATVSPMIQSSYNLFLFDRQESVGIKTSPGAAKVMGTVVCVGGAMLLSFYRGQTIQLGESGIHWKYAELMRGEAQPTKAAASGAPSA